MLSIFIFIVTILICTKCFEAFTITNRKSSIVTKHAFVLNMGLADMFKNALANDPNLPPVQNAGLSSNKEPVEVEFLPSNKRVKAYLGQNLALIAKTAKVDIKYKCSKGECGTCTVNFNGSNVKACISSLPYTSNLKKFTIGIPTK